jgi:hypothetical protein
MKYKLLWAVGVLFILADVGITYWAVTGGHAQEANPNMKAAMEEFGLEAAVAGSVMVRLLMAAPLLFLQRRMEQEEYLMPLVYCGIAIFPVVWNAVVLL